MKIIGLFLVIIMILPVFTTFVTPDEQSIENDNESIKEHNLNYDIISIQNKLYNFSNISTRLTSVIVEFENENKTMITETNGKNVITPYLDSNMSSDDYQILLYNHNQSNKKQWIMLTGNQTFINQSSNNSFKEDILITP